MKTTFFSKIFCLINCILIVSCHGQEEALGGTEVDINTEHLESLFDVVSVEGSDSVGIIYIYSEYPNYTWIGDSDEGIACVDDAARAGIFYLRNYHYTGNADSREKALQLIQFILTMQSEGGYFYNFIFDDYSINREGITSRAEANWWSWRAFWLLAESVKILEADHPVQDRISLSIEKLLTQVRKDFLDKTQNYKLIDGVLIPQWLPGESAADQAALLTLALNICGNPILKEQAEMLQLLNDGILKMQIEYDTFPDGAFLSWENIWHAYGNSQAYALLMHAWIHEEQDSVEKVALRELDYFYPAWLNKNGLSSFRIRKVDDGLQIYDQQKFPQIAYDLRPMIWACIAAGKMTREQKYYDLARQLAAWFMGSNPTSLKMYDASTGRGYDGIIDEETRNLNSGAESTIEALLALQELKYMMSENSLPWLRSN